MDIIKEIYSFNIPFMTIYKIQLLRTFKNVLNIPIHKTILDGYHKGNIFIQYSLYDYL